MRPQRAPLQQQVLPQHPRDALGAGEVGYITASIKTVADTQVGDTITSLENPAAEPLPG